MNKKHTVGMARRRTQMALAWLNGLDGWPQRESVTTHGRKTMSGSHGCLESN